MSGSTAIETAGAEQTMRLAAAVARLARPGDVIGLTGELGAGKTRFVRGLAQGLGLDPAAVSSPTFILMQEYEPAPGTPGTPGIPGAPGETGSPESAGSAATVLVHIDAYRLGDSGAMSTIGWEGRGEAIRAGAIVAVEWADLVCDGFGDHWLDVTLAHTSHGRRIEIKPHGDWRPRMATLDHALAATGAPQHRQGAH